MADRKQRNGGILVDLALYAVSALISFALLNNVLKKLDPNASNAKQARRWCLRRLTRAPLTALALLLARRRARRKRLQHA
jgi:hypothetical protein